MEVINKDKAASVVLAEVRVSTDEMMLYEAALSYLLERLGASEVEHRFGATRDEIEGMRDDLREALAQCGEPSHKPVPA